jgi:heme exporter protein D|tara:strand:- start:28 stop:252 length:225 start_codon:yes stop_codon:yes gene_type:complete
MALKILILGGYGHFVWPAFIFTFLSCLTLYIKTKKSLKKYEKMYLNEYKVLENTNIITPKDKKITKEALSGSSI